MNVMEGRDLFLRYQCPKSNTVRHLRVWDALRCFNSEQTNAINEDPPVLVTLASEADYIDYRRDSR